MKPVAVFCALFLLHLVEGRSVNPVAEDPITLTPLQEQCLQELKLTEKRNEIANINTRAMCPENNPEFNKFISCFWKKTGRQNENGEVNYETVKLFVHQGILQGIGNDVAAQKFAEQSSLKIVNDCKNIQDGNSEKLIAKVRNCLVKGLESIDEA